MALQKTNIVVQVSTNGSFKLDRADPNELANLVQVLIDAGLNAGVNSDLVDKIVNIETSVEK